VEDVTVVEHLEGPDQIIPASSHKSWSIFDAVRLQLEPESIHYAKPISIYSMFENSAEKYAKTNALAVKRNGHWVYWTYEEYFNQTEALAKGLISLGLEPGCGVCIKGANSPEWFLTNFGTIFAGGVTVGLHAETCLDSLLHMANDSRSQIIVVDTAEDAHKVLEMKHKLPHLRHVLQLGAEPCPPGALLWSDVLDLGLGQDSALEDRLRRQAVNACCSLIYTSGTTGPPKAVMYSQDNLTFTGRCFSDQCGLIEGDTMISYLPLNHIAGQMNDLYVALFGGVTMYFAEPDALKGSIVNTLKEVQPVHFLTVPRMLQRIESKISEQINQAGFVKKTLINWSLNQALSYHYTDIDGKKQSQTQIAKYALAKNLVLDKVKAQLGLSNTYNFLAGAAPMSAELMDFFLSLDLPIINAYGMSESSSAGSLTFIRNGNYRSGSTGRPMQGMRMRVIPADKTGGLIENEGEICFKGRGVFMGYLNEESKTHETIREDGWMKSGDLGYFDSDGFLHLSGRSKELIITAGGENIPPLNIEASIKKELPVLSNVIVIGEQRKFLSALLTLESEQDPNTGLPLDTLAPQVTQWLASLGSEATTVTEVVEEMEEGGSAVTAAIEDAVERYNSSAAPTNAHKVRRWSLLRRELAKDTGELTSTMKLKRAQVELNHKHTIEAMYTEAQPQSKIRTRNSSAKRSIPMTVDTPGLV